LEQSRVLDGPAARSVVFDLAHGGSPASRERVVKPEGLWVRSRVVKIADRGLWGAALVLGLAFWCLPGLWAQEPSLREQRAFFKEAKSQLLNPSPSARASAVRKLSKLGTREAWELIWEALDDGQAEAADAAQLALRDCDAERVLKKWAGREGLRSKDLGRRWRLAETTGWLQGPFEARELAAWLRAGDDETTRLLLRSVERLAQRGRIVGGSDRLVSRLASLARSSRASGAVNGGALLALAQVDASQVGSLALPAMRSKKPELRVGALLALEEWVAQSQSDGRNGVGVSQLEEGCRHLAADDSVLVRRALYSLLGRFPRRSSVELLVAALKMEEAMRLRLQVIAALQELSGLRYRGDPRPWQAWLGELKPGPLPTPQRGSKTPQGEGRTAAEGSLRLPLNSDRVALLIDLSGSVQQKLKTGNTRKEALDQYIRNTLKVLPVGTLFQLVPYAARPHPWPDEPEVADRRMGQRAQEYYDDLHLAGTGDLWEALELTLAGGELDSVLILSDGAPTGGFHWDLGLFVQLTLERVRLAPVSFDLVLVDAGKRVTAHWKKLAEQTGGTLASVKLAAPKKQPAKKGRRSKR